MRARTDDPMEHIVREALRRARIKFVEEEDPRARALDFYLPEADVHIEVKQFHTDRIAEQMGRVPNIIAIQGVVAAELFAALITKEEIAHA